MHTPRLSGGTQGKIQNVSKTEAGSFLKSRNNLNYSSCPRSAHEFIHNIPFEISCGHPAAKAASLDSVVKRFVSH